MILGPEEASDKDEMKARVEVMIIIFVVSLFGGYSYLTDWAVLTTYN
jgi:hypothetical protein